MLNGQRKLCITRAAISHVVDTGQESPQFLYIYILIKTITATLSMTLSISFLLLNGPQDTFLPIGLDCWSLNFRNLLVYRLPQSNRFEIIDRRQPEVPPSGLVFIPFIQLL